MRAVLGGGLGWYEVLGGLLGLGAVCTAVLHGPLQQAVHLGRHTGVPPMDDYNYDDGADGDKGLDGGVGVLGQGPGQHPAKPTAKHPDKHPAKHSAKHTAKHPATEKPARTRPKLDMERLLRDARGFKFLRSHGPAVLALSGGQRGHEAHDLAQLTTLWQEWAQLLFPRAALPDFVRRIEELCRHGTMREYLRRLTLAARDAADAFDDALFLVDHQMQQVTGVDGVKGVGTGTQAAPKPVAFEDDELERLLREKDAGRKRARPAEYADDEGDSDEDSSDGDATDLRDFINDGEEDAGRSDAEVSDADSASSHLSQQEHHAHTRTKRTVGRIADDDE